MDLTKTVDMIESSKIFDYARIDVSITNVQIRADDLREIAGSRGLAHMLTASEWIPRERTLSFYFHLTTDNI